MRTITDEELKKIIDDNYQFRADLSYVDLSRKDLSKVRLNGAMLFYANLTEANLTEANLVGTNLYGACLLNANLYGACLINANLYGASLRGANLYNADLSRANLSEADLSDTDLRGSKINFPIACPETGSFIGWKKAADGYIVKLEILEDSKRSSATGRKCRCDKARVLAIKDIDGTVSVNEVRSNYDPDFIYKVGEIVSVDNFEDNRWDECAPGIHFFLTRDEAVQY